MDAFPKEKLLKVVCPVFLLPDLYEYVTWLGESDPFVFLEVAIHYDF